MKKDNKNVIKNEIIGRNKTGKSMMDWVKLLNTGKDMRNVGKKLLKLTIEEISKHNKKEDCWIILNG